MKNIRKKRLTAQKSSEEAVDMEAYYARAEKSPLGLTIKALKDLNKPELFRESVAHLMWVNEHGSREDCETLAVMVYSGSKTVAGFLKNGRPPEKQRTGITDQKAGSR